MNKLGIFLSFVIFCFSFSAFAQKEQWEANAGFSAVVNSGNAVNQTVGGNSLLSYKVDKNKISWTGNGAYGRAKSGGVTSTNTKNWNTVLRYDRFVSNAISLYALSKIGADEPAGFELRYGGSAGLAHSLIDTNIHKFQYEAGFDFTREERLPEPDANIYAARSFSQYRYRFSKTASFTQDLEALFNVKQGKDIRVNTLSALQINLKENLAFQSGFAIRFDNQPVTGRKKLDTTTQIGLAITFL
ncbi:MAG: DUF481 domain-containing protein [Bdellovibrionales bacterium]|nr:DUF481 domain-containing protein [Bdellovibrionales bacterium]